MYTVSGYAKSLASWYLLFCSEGDTENDVRQKWGGVPDQKNKLESFSCSLSQVLGFKCKKSTAPGSNQECVHKVCPFDRNPSSPAV